MNGLSGRARFTSNHPSSDDADAVLDARCKKPFPQRPEEPADQKRIGSGSHVTPAQYSTMHHPMGFLDRTPITFARRLAPSPPRRCHQTATKTYIFEFRPSTRTIAARQPPYAHVPRLGIVYATPAGIAPLQQRRFQPGYPAQHFVLRIAEILKLVHNFLPQTKNVGAKLVIVIYNGEVRISDLKECLLRLRRWLAFTVR